MVDDNDFSDGPDAGCKTTQKTVHGLTWDYSKIASRYDGTRDLPEEKLMACYDRLIGQSLFPTSGKILDAGCGTGQVSLPLAARGHDVHGIDISQDMTALAQSKVLPTWRADYRVGDVRKLTLDDRCFDAVVVSKLFQHVEDWRGACRELIRVVRPGGYIVQINERGAFGNSVRRDFSRRADALGFRGRYAGLNPHSGEELAAFMREQGCQPIQVDMSDLRWSISISYGEAISRIQDGLFAEFWPLPREVYHRLIDDTLAWIETQPDGSNTIEHLQPYLVVELFRTPNIV